MKIVNVSYNIPTPECTDPEAWVKKIRFSTGIFESMASYAEIVAIHHIRYKGDFYKNGVTYYFPGYTRWQLLMPFAFNRYIKKLRPDVVIVHGLISPWQVVMLRAVLGGNVGIIGQHHAERPLRYFRAFFQRWADRCFDAYLFTSRNLAIDWKNKHLIRNLEKVKEVMEASSPFHSLDISEARKVTGVRGSTTFIWVGGLELRKNPVMAVKAFVDFLQTEPEARLYMIYQSTELLHDVEQVALSHPNISLVGQVSNDDLLYWYNSVHYVISSSFYEGSGVAVCEAMSCGCIPILTDIPSFRMMTGVGKVGVLYESGNEKGLVDALHKALTLNAAKERENVLQQFKNVLSNEAIARNTMNIIEEII
ncbi:glycosyltransferase family 4 protein [Chryseolinea soli]|uniref:Glycosyltransferase n=1 Tax=Chryseolinea soli TaxID=2321403 RepID=A0A385SQD3_9BACT|nr:glycosyltransferase family 4 protein [Chryseolinea soli]AYB31158.1 glycosyltransferase [Chryseolinea soli]